MTNISLYIGHLTNWATAHAIWWSLIILTTLTFDYGRTSYISPFSANFFCSTPPPHCGDEHVWQTCVTNMCDEHMYLSNKNRIISKVVTNISLYNGHLREAFKKKKIKSVGFFHTSQTPPLPPLKCGNTFWGKNFFLQFHPENDLPTHKNWIK